MRSANVEELKASCNQVKTNINTGEYRNMRKSKDAQIYIYKYTNIQQNTHTHIHTYVQFESNVHK